MNIRKKTLTRIQKILVFGFGNWVREKKRVRSHADLEGFDKSKQIQVTSWPLDPNRRVSVCTGWNGKHWLSTVRIKYLARNKFSGIVEQIPLSFRVSGVDAHVIAVNEIKGRKQYGG